VESGGNPFFWFLVRKVSWRLGWHGVQILVGGAPFGQPFPQAFFLAAEWTFQIIAIFFCSLWVFCLRITSREGVGFVSERNAVTIITRDEVIEVPETTKWDVAQRVLDQAAHLRSHTRAAVKATN